MLIKCQPIKSMETNLWKANYKMLTKWKKLFNQENFLGKLKNFRCVNEVVGWRWGFEGYRRASVDSRLYFN